MVWFLREINESDRAVDGTQLVSGSEEVMTRGRVGNNMSIYRTRVQFPVENQMPWGRQELVVIFLGISRAMKISQIFRESPRNPDTSSSKPRGPLNSSVCSKGISRAFWIIFPCVTCSPREGRKIFPLCEGQKQGNIFFLWPFPPWDIVRLSWKKTVLEIKYTWVEIHSLLFICQASNSASIASISSPTKWE